MLSAERQEFGGREKRGDGQVYAAGVGERHCIQGPVGKRKEEGERSRKYLKKYFGEAEKIPTFAAPQVGKEKEKKDRRRKADGE